MLGLSYEFPEGRYPDVHACLWVMTTSIPLTLKLTLLVCSLLSASRTTPHP